jgi:Domain of unknown function (DUF4350)
MTRLPADPRVRALLGIGAGVLVFVLVLLVVARLTPSPHGPASSSFATSPSGLAAYASLLEREGRPVRRLVAPVRDRAPALGETLVVLDPDVVEDDEARAIGDWVRAGGRLIAGGTRHAGWLEHVLAAPPEWQPEPAGRAETLVPVAETVSVRAVRTADGGGWHAPGGALPAIGPAGAPLLVVARSGRGSVALLADASPLQNRLLGTADSAALGLGLAGPGPVAFLETVHGYGVSRGVSALPARVKWTLLGLLAAGLLALWTAGRRLGPAEDDDTPPAPARIEYVDALAAALGRAKPRRRRREPPAETSRLPPTSTQEERK